MKSSEDSELDIMAPTHESHLGDASVPALPSTAVPIREQFRCRRFWFFYHDLRAFTTSWLPLPIFVIYRILLAIYTIIWLALHISARSDEVGPFWLIFFTNLGYTLLTITTTSLAILCTVYAIFHYSGRTQRHLRHFPKRDFPLRRIYKQDNIPWHVKAVWYLYLVACSSAVVIFLGYWLIVYTPCSDDDDSNAGGNATPTTMMTMGQGMTMSNSSDDDFVMMSSGNGTGNSSRACFVPDVHTIQVHGINVVLILLDLVLSRIPYHLLHFAYASSYSAAYAIFSLIYWGAGGVNHNGEPFIYSALNYGENSISFFFAVVIAVAPMIFFGLLFLVAWLRDVISAKVGCCFRDVRQFSYRDSAEDEQEMTGV